VGRGGESAKSNYKPVKRARKMITGRERHKREKMVGEEVGYCIPPAGTRNREYRSHKKKGGGKEKIHCSEIGKNEKIPPQKNTVGWS